MFLSETRLMPLLLLTLPVFMQGGGGGGGGGGVVVVMGMVVAAAGVLPLVDTGGASAAVVVLVLIVVIVAVVAVAMAVAVAVGGAAAVAVAAHICYVHRVLLALCQSRLRMLRGRRSEWIQDWRVVKTHQEETDTELR